MKTTPLLSFIAACGLFCPALASAETVIVSDSFTGINEASLSGRTPDGVDLFGRTWTTAGFSGTAINTAAGNPAPSAVGGFNGVVRMDVGSTGGYIKPSDFTLSLDLQMVSISGGTSFARGLGLGFYSAPTTGEANQFFNGLTMMPDGSLVLVVNGTVQAASAPAPAGYNTNTFYKLTYSVDLVTGGITSVNFAGTDVTATFSGATSAGVFTDSATQSVGFYHSSAAFSGSPGFDNFQLSANGPVPEPSTVLLILGGLSALALRRRKSASPTT
jgi:hypothetical protein